MAPVHAKPHASALISDGPPAGQWAFNCRCGARYPGGSQYGARFNRRRGYEASICFFDGFNVCRTSPPPGFVGVAVQRYYPQLRLYGADRRSAAWFTAKAKGDFTSTTSGADSTRSSFSWAASEVVVRRRICGRDRDARTAILDFAPSGFARSWLGRWLDH
jgi:hypothetical protein